MADPTIDTNPSAPTETALTAPPETSPSYDWRTDIHPDVKDSKLWESVPDIKTLTKAYADATTYNVGAIKLPANDAPDSEWEAVWNKLGRPSSPEAYPNYHTPTETPDEDPEWNDKLKAICHSAGITAYQWERLAKGWNRIHGEKDTIETTRGQETVRTLKAEYGAAYEPQLGLAQRAIRTFGGEETMDAIVKRGLGNDVGFIRMMMKVGKALAEQRIITANVEGVPSTSDAKALIDQLTASKEYLDATHPMHKQTVEKVTQLFEVVYN